MIVVVRQRKSLRVEAVQVTAENLLEVAAWCGGVRRIYQKSVETTSGDFRSGQECVEVVISRNEYGRENKGRAYIGGWVTRVMGRSTPTHRVYTDHAFSEAFEKIKTSPEKLKKVHEIVWEAMYNQYVHDSEFDKAKVEETVLQIAELFAP